MTNPFFNRGPIRESRFYFSRPKETREVMRLLAGSQNCSIVGPVKSGKTSFLLHLARPATLSAHGLSPAQYAPVYLSFEGLGTLRAGAVLPPDAARAGPADLRPHRARSGPVSRAGMK